jgi:hypothetical protein
MIADDGYIGLVSEKSQRVKSLKSFRIDASPIIDPRCTFNIGKFLRDSIRDHLGKFIIDHRSLILFGVSKVGSIVE